MSLAQRINKCHTPSGRLPHLPRACSSIVRLHQLVRLYHFRKTFNACCVRPRFDLTLLPHNISKAPGPTISWKSFDDIFDRTFGDELSVQARIVEDGGKMDDRCESADHACVAEVLVSYDRFADGFGLRNVCLMGFE